MGILLLDHDWCIRLLSSLTHSPFSLPHSSFPPVPSWLMTIGPAHELASTAFPVAVLYPLEILQHLSISEGEILFQCGLLTHLKFADDGYSFSNHLWLSHDLFRHSKVYYTHTRNFVYNSVVLFALTNCLSSRC